MDHLSTVVPVPCEGGGELSLLVLARRERPRMRGYMSRAAMPVLVLVALVLGACDSSGLSIKAAAPLLPSMVIPYVAGSSGSTPGGVTALLGRDGTIAWHAPTGDPSSHWAPIVMGGVLYTEGGSAQPFTGEIVNASIIAVRLTDGRVLWRTLMTVGDFGLATDGSLLLVAAGKSGLYALDASDGAILWHQAVPNDGEVVAGAGTLVVTRTDFVAPNTYVQSACLAAFRERDGAPLWCTPYYSGAAVGVTPTAVITSDGSHLVQALASSTGQFLWEGAVQGSVLAVNDQRVLVCGVQRLTALDAATGHLVWQSSSTFDASPSAAWSEPSGAVYGAYQDEVVALRAGDGTELWRASYGDYMAIQLVVEGGVLFVLLASQVSSPQVRLVAVTADSGVDYWQRDLPDNVLFLADIVATG
jgi:outer membrane protein assembly factor BamB